MHSKQLQQQFTWHPELSNRMTAFCHEASNITTMVYGLPFVYLLNHLSIMFNPVLLVIHKDHNNYYGCKFSEVLQLFFQYGLWQHCIMLYTIVYLAPPDNLDPNVFCIAFSFSIYHIHLCKHTHIS